MSMEMSRLSENRARYVYVDQSWRWVIIMIRRGQLRHLHSIHSIRLILSGCIAQGITEGSMRMAYFISVDVWTAR